MLTLTQRPAAIGLGPSSGRQCEQALRRHWKEAIRLARKLAEANWKYEQWNEKPQGTPYRSTWLPYWAEQREKWRQILGSAIPEWAREEYDKTEFWKAAYESITYLWQKECEVNLDAKHYHWHLHVALPSRRSAELVNAAWQATRYPWQQDLCRTDIQTAESVGCDADDLASYLVKYLTGTRSGHFLGPDANGTDYARYFEQMQDVRLYAAGGDWRPIGVAPEANSEDPVLAVAWGDHNKWYTWAEWWNDGGQEVAQRAAGLGDKVTLPIELATEAVERDQSDKINWRARNILEQVRNNFEGTAEARAPFLCRVGLSPPRELRKAYLRCKSIGEPLEPESLPTKWKAPPDLHSGVLTCSALDERFGTDTVLGGVNGKLNTLELTKCLPNESSTNISGGQCPSTP